MTNKERLAIERQNVKRILHICPEMQDRSGIGKFEKKENNLWENH